MIINLRIFVLNLNIKSNQILKKIKIKNKKKIIINPITYSCTATASLYSFSVLRISKNKETRRRKERRETRRGEKPETRK